MPVYVCICLCMYVCVCVCDHECVSVCDQVGNTENQSSRHNLHITNNSKLFTSIYGILAHLL